MKVICYVADMPENVAETYNVQHELSKNYLTNIKRNKAWHNGSSNSNPVSQPHTGLHDRPIESSTHELAKLSSLFSAFRKCLKLQN